MVYKRYVWSYKRWSVNDCWVRYNGLEIGYPLIGGWPRHCGKPDDLENELWNQRHYGGWGNSYRKPGHAIVIYELWAKPMTYTQQPNYINLVLQQYGFKNASFYF